MAPGLRGQRDGPVHARAGEHGSAACFARVPGSVGRPLGTSARERRGTQVKRTFRPNPGPRWATSQEG
eukprot:6951336-Alexandrium_andersonii.AAC.1